MIHNFYNPGTTDPEKKKVTVKKATVKKPVKTEFVAPSIWGRLGDAAKGFGRGFSNTPYVTNSNRLSQGAPGSGSRKGNKDIAKATFNAFSNARKSFWASKGSK